MAKNIMGSSRERIALASVSGFSIGLILAFAAFRANAEARPYTPPGTTYPIHPAGSGSAISPAPASLPIAGAIAAWKASRQLRRRLSGVAVICAILFVAGSANARARASINCAACAVAPVPSTLPLAGAVAALSFSRRLRRRIHG